FATDTDISVLPSTETKASDNGLLGWVALTGQTHISAEEAQETALATAMQMREVEGIVTKAPLKIGSIEVVKGDTRKPYVPTKGNAKPEQADVYIVNFANNQGYVITSADRRVPSVLAYNSYGHLGDTISNPGQAVLFSYIQAYIEEQRAAFEANKEKLITEAEEAIFKQLSKEQQEKLIAKGYFDKDGKRVKSKYNFDLIHALCDLSEPESNNKKNENPADHYLVKDNDRIFYGEWKTEYVKAPLLKTLWRQSGLYNDKVAKYCDADKDQSPVGCVAVAVGQLLAYHKKPAIFKGRIMHWDDITKIDSGDMFSSIYSHNVGDNATFREDIQHLLAHLGDSDLLAMEYGCIADGGSGSGRALEALHSLGYNNASLIEYSNGDFISEIRNNRPVYIEGYSYEISHTYTTGWWFWKKSHTRYSYKEGHAWILDGYVLRKRKVTEYYINCPSSEEVKIVNDEKIELIHNNFGWGGNLDGSDFKWNKDYYDGTGWYNINVFNAKSGRQAGSNTYKSGTEGNYQFKKKIIINIK
ncbi:peptidase C10 family protein, partial [Capnocytophaga sp. oral taxon 412 str. F0487]|uniref:C10 family peptidase n=1 Tax=Capnocytophaga sp. oral taxon 412 TaxID=712218 RepID=UPI000269663E